MARILLLYYKLSVFSWVVMIKINSLMIIDAGDKKMSENTKEIYEQEMVVLNKTFLGFLIGTGAIVSMWFLSGICYVILH